MHLICYCKVFSFHRKDAKQKFVFNRTACLHLFHLSTASLEPVCRHLHVTMCLSCCLHTAHLQHYSRDKHQYSHHQNVIRILIQNVMHIYMHEEFLLHGTHHYPNTNQGTLPPRKDLLGNIEQTIGHGYCSRKSDRSSQHVEGAIMYRKDNTPLGSSGKLFSLCFPGISHSITTEETELFLLQLF